MDEYTKINTIWKRDDRGKIIVGEYATPEFEYLSTLDWEWTEKVDGTNIRVGWDGVSVEFGGRTAKAQIPPKLLATLQTMLPPENFVATFGETPVTLYGEGYGAGIQSGGNYSPDQTFVLFDVKVKFWWLRREDVTDVANKLSLRVVPIIGHGSLPWASNHTSRGLISTWGAFPAEGMVGRPLVDLYSRRNRIIAKTKVRDYE